MTGITEDGKIYFGDFDDDYNADHAWYFDVKKNQDGLIVEFDWWLEDVDSDSGTTAEMYSVGEYEYPDGATSDTGLTVTPTSELVVDICYQILTDLDSDVQAPAADKRGPNEGACKNRHENPSATCNDDVPMPVYLIREESQEAAEFVACTVAVAGAPFVIGLATAGVAATVGSAAVVRVGVQATTGVLKAGLTACGNEYGEMQQAKKDVREEVKRRKKESNPGN